jgi:8-oxo-dGTP pyrophosphatase MutT (NUDIX family)
MMEIVRIKRLELAFAPRPWPFAQERRAEIDAHFAAARHTMPDLWNGRVMLLHDWALADGSFQGAYFETDFASMLAWRDWDFPDASVRNCFAQGALRSADGAFLLGVMAAHTANAGKIYFPSGTPDPHDINGETIDLDGSVMRELAEETGLAADEVEPRPGWHAVFAGPRIGMMKVLQSAAPATQLRARILGHLGRQKQPELADIRIVRGPTDLDPMMPSFIPAFLHQMWT